MDIYIEREIEIVRDYRNMLSMGIIEGTRDHNLVCYVYERCKLQQVAPIEIVYEVISDLTGREKIIPNKRGRAINQRSLLTMQELAYQLERGEFYSCGFF